MIRWMMRAILTLAAFALLGVGLWRAEDWDYGRWMIAMAIAGALLAISWWPTTGRGMPIFNRTLLSWATILAVIFFLVTVQLVRIQIVRGDEIANRTVVAPNGDIAQNPRVTSANADVQRGSILDRDGQVIVESVLNEFETYERVYHDPAMAGVTGYYSPLLYGSSGVEAQFNKYLSGEEGGNPVDEWLDSVLHREQHGYDVELTLDSNLQQQANDLLAGRPGAVVLMEANSGDVLAMASAPGYDPNKISIEPGPTSDEELATANSAWESISTDPSSPLVFRPTQGLYVPGSVFKMVTAAAALDSGEATPETAYRDEGSLVVDGRVIIGLNRPDETKVSWTLEESFAHSLNVVFAQIGLDLGAETLWDYAQRFGFGEQIPFALPVAPSQLASDRAALNERTLLADTGFGQGQILATPLQMAMITAAIANDGTMMQLRIASEVIGQDGETLTRFDAEPWRQPISEETAQEMQRLMEASAAYGYASGAQIEGVTVGGKTGTAEAGEAGAHSWFTGYAVDGDKTYVVAVIVEHAGSGSATALPIGRSLMVSAIEQLGDAPIE